METVLVLFILLVFGIVSIVSYKAFDDINEDIQQDLGIAQEARDDFQNLKTRFPSSMDGIFAVAFGLLWIIVLVSAFLIDSHPVFFIISVILLITLLFAAGWISNAYNEIESDDILATYAADFPITSYILNHLMHVVFLIGISIAIVMYGKSRT